MEHEVKERRKRLGRTTAANAGMFVFSSLVSIATGNKAFFAEAVHDAADTTAHGSRYAAEARGIDQNTRRFRLFRRAGLIALGSLSAWTALRIGIDWQQGVQESIAPTREMAEFGSAMVIAAGNMYAYNQMDTIENHSHVSHDSHHHARTDMVASIGLATCIAADAVGLDGASQWGGMLFASYTAIELFNHSVRLEH